MGAKIDTKERKRKKEKEENIRFSKVLEYAYLSTDRRPTYLPTYLGRQVPVQIILERLFNHLSLLSLTCAETSVTRLGNLLDLGQILKAFGNN